jgi:hypothetical protein
LLAAPLDDPLTDGVGGLGGQRAVVDLDDLLPASRGVKTADEPAGGIGSERILELVAIPPLLGGRDDRLERVRVEMTDTRQRLLHLGLLDLELARIGDHLPGCARMVGPRGDPVGARLEDLDRTGLGVSSLALAHHRAHAVAGHRAGDE